MANNPYVNKVEFGDQTLMDITDTTATANDVVNGKVFYGANGARTVGSASIPENTSDLTNDGDGTSPFVTEDGADDTYVKKTGDTMTGDLRIRDDTFPTSTPSTSLYGGKGFGVDDGNGDQIIFMCGEYLNDGRRGINLGTGRNVNGTDVYNSINLDIDGSGNPQVYVSDATAWRTALEFPFKLGKSGTTYGYYKDGETTLTPFRNPTGNATVAQVLSGRTFSNASSDSLTGEMPNRGAVSETLDCGDEYTIPAGYHNGSGKVTANSLASQTGVDSGYSAATNATIRSGYQAWVNGVKRTGSMATLTDDNFSGTHSGDTAGEASTYTVKSTSAGYVPNNTTVNSLTAGTSATIATTAASGTKTINCIPGYYNKIKVNQTAAYNAGKAAGSVQLTKVGTLTDFGYKSSSTGAYSSKTGTTTFTVKSTISAYASLTINNFFFRDITTKANSTNIVSLYLKLYSYNASTGVLTVQYTVSSSGGSYTNRQTTFSADVYCAWSA